MLVAVAGLGLAACGGGEDRLSQEEFVEQGNAICAAGTARQEKAAEAAFGDASAEDPPSEEEFVAFIRESIIPDLERQFDELDDLNPPEDVEDDLDEGLAAARKAVDTAKENPDSMLEEDSDVNFERANTLLARTGLDVCAEDA